MKFHTTVFLHGAKLRSSTPYQFIILWMEAVLFRNLFLKRELRAASNLSIVKTRTEKPFVFEYEDVPCPIIVLF